jgi:hypothetical protein
MNAFHDTVAFFKDADRVINCVIKWKFEFPSDGGNGSLYVCHIN